MPRVFSPSLAGRATISGSERIEFDSEGYAEVSDAQAERLAGIPGFSVVDDEDPTTEPVKDPSGSESSVDGTSSGEELEGEDEEPADEGEVGDEEKEADETSISEEIDQL